MKEESDFSICRNCGGRKLRKFVGYFDERNKKYEDENGKLWNGRKCGTCASHKSKLGMRAKRQREKDAKSTVDVKD